MKKMVTIGLLGAGIMTALSASAVTPGFFLQAQAGYGGMYTRKMSAGSASLRSVDLRKGVAGRVSVGYLWSRNRFAYGVEGGYETYPDNKYVTTREYKYKGYNLDFLAVVDADIVAGLFAEAKAGYAFVQQNYQQRVGTTITTDIDSNKWLPMFSAGVGYELTHRFDVNVNYNYILGDHANPFASAAHNQNRVSTVSAILLGVKYKFA